MRPDNRPSSKSRLLYSIVLPVMFCVATAIGSPAQVFTTLHNFDSNEGPPFAGLVQGTGGNLYGTTTGGPNSGTVFTISTSGVFNTVYSFDFSGAQGAFPSAGLVQAPDGNFYGTTELGGADDFGTVFKITPGGVLTPLYSFTGGSDGIYPVAALVQGTDGNFYGTTFGGGGDNCSGTVFKMTPGGGITTLHTFSGPDGGQPTGTLVQATDGSFYGTTQYGGGATGNCSFGGTVFRITSDGALTTLYRFCSLPNCADGETPHAGLVQGTDGNFYGTTEGGGTNPAGGTVFKISPTGTLTTIYNFCVQPNCPTASGPSAALVQASDGNFYGTTRGDTNGVGATIFKITPGGTLTTLHTFQGSDGYRPLGALIQATDGNLYGTTSKGGSDNAGTVFSLTGPNPTPVQFVPVAPCRLVDTRQPGGSPIQGGTWQVFVVPQLGGCNIPPTASAYSLNVTLVPQQHHHVGYLTIWPAERTMPYVSTMNSQDGRTKANAAIVPSGASGAVSVYATDTTDVILDIDGYFTAPSSQTLQFYSLPPCRVVDTRQTNLPQGLGAPSFGNMETRRLPILTTTCPGLPSQPPQAYSFNVTVVPNPPGQQLNYLTIWPSNEQTMPYVSTLNNPTATAVANAAIVPADPSTGDVSVFTFNSTDVIIDTNGYFAAPGAGGYSFYPVAPCRAYDSRNNNGQPFTGERTVPIASSPCAPPTNAQAYVFNATVVPSGSLGYLTLWPDGSQDGQPLVSTLNAYDGFITSNMAIVPNIDGSTDAFAAAGYPPGPGSGYTQLILDISGYFAP